MACIEFNFDIRNKVTSYNNMLHPAQAPFML